MITTTDRIPNRTNRLYPGMGGSVGVGVGTKGYISVGSKCGFFITSMLNPTPELSVVPNT